MKIADIINQLRGVLPKYTEYFGDTVSIVSIVALGGTATIITSSAHGLVNGTNIVLSDVSTETPIDSISQSGLVFTFTTSVDHDLTYGWPEHSTVTLSGFTDANWNNSFSLIAVPNRRTFKVSSSNTIAVLNGNEVLNEIRADGVNGRYSVVVIDPTTISVSGDFIDGTYIGGIISAAQRISGAITETRALEQYTEQNLNDMWMFVIPGDAVVSRDRNSYSDVVSSKNSGVDMRLRLIDGFTILIIKNTTEDIAAITAVDICRHDLLLPILKSVNGVKFDTGLSGEGEFKTILKGHNYADYNRAYLVYAYEFEVAMDLTSSDSVQPSDTVAFRDIYYQHDIGGNDTTPLTIDTINLDEEPL